MAQTVKLSELSTKLIERASARRSGSSGFALFLVTLLVFDGVERLHGSGLGWDALVNWAMGSNIEPTYLLYGVIGAQVFILLIVGPMVSSSGIKSLVGNDLTSILTLGAGSTVGNRRNRIIRQLGFLIFTAVFLIIEYLYPLQIPFSLGPTAFVLFALSVTFPIFAGWICSVLLIRSPPNYSLFIGIISAVMISTLVGSLSGSADTSSEMENVTWFLGAELIFLNALALIVAASIMFGGATVYNLSTDDAEQALALVTHEPFSNDVPTPDFLTFHGGSGQIVALTRVRNASYYETANINDPHLRIPLYDRSLLIWNFTRLSKNLPNRIEVTDSHGYFKLSGSLGNLAIPASVPAGVRFELPAVAITNEALFKNSDLKGLLERAATAALSQQVSGEYIIIDEILEILQDAPSKLQVLGANPLDGNEHVLKSEQIRINSFVQKANAHLERIKNANRDFRQVARRGLVVQNEMQQKWLECIISDVTQATQDHGMKNSGSSGLSEAVRVLNVVGLRLNNATIVPIGQAATCETMLTSARKTLEGEVEAASSRHLALEDRLLALREEMAKQAAAGRPLTRDQADGLIAHVLGGAADTRRDVLPQQEKAQPLLNSPDEDSAPN